MIRNDIANQVLFLPIQEGADELCILSAYACIIRELMGLG